MPSRFLTLWSLLGRPQNSKKKKEAAQAQVRYRSGFTPDIPVYGEVDTSPNGSVDDNVLVHRSATVVRRSNFFRKSGANVTKSVIYQCSSESAYFDWNNDLLNGNPSQSATVVKSQSVGGLSQRSSRVCHAKRVAPPIVPESSHHRHSGSSFDSGGSSATESSGGYCSGSGASLKSSSTCGGGSGGSSGTHTPSTLWSGCSGAPSGGDQRHSIGLDDQFPPPASPDSIAGKHMYTKEGEPVYGRTMAASPGHHHGAIFSFPPSTTGTYGQTVIGRTGSQPSSPHCCGMDQPHQQQPAKSADYGTLLPHPNYCHQISLEDQGIDLTQSPGRESPSSSTGSSSLSGGLKSITSSSASNGHPTSAGIGPAGVGGPILPGCRHSTTSTTSLDSGRASSSYDHAHRHGSSSSSSTSSGQPGMMPQQHRFSGQSYESCVLRHSYHSSSSSLGSSGKSDDIHRLNIAEMLSQGVPEHEILNAWLTDLGFEEYYDLFVQSGYDMHTITRMTPEDLTAIGIQKPNHRKKLKAEIAQLHIPDGLPEFIPDTLEEWLSLLGLAEYSPSLRRQGYRTVEDVTQLTWEDLEDFGILRLGHQKKITLAIKRVKDILSGKFVASPTESPHGSCCYVTQEVVIGQSVGHVTSPKDSAELSTFHQYRSSHYAIPPVAMRPVYMAPQQQQQVQHPHPCYPQHPPHPQHQQHPQYAPQPLPQPIQQPIYYQYQQPTYQPDVVAIQVHRNRSTEDIRAVNPLTNQQTFYKPGWRQRSYEDGDITPVSEHPSCHAPGGGTLPRPRNTVKPRPVAKISAKSRENCDCADGSAPVEPMKVNPAPVAPSGGLPSHYAYGNKKNPPPAPPKRSSSAEEEPLYGRLPKTSPLALPLPPPPTGADAMSLLSYSEDSEDFPPPPAPITASDSYLQHGQASSAAASVRERLDNILQRSGAGHWPRPQQPIYAPSALATSRFGNGVVPNMKTVVSPRDRECSPCDSIDASDTEPGSPAMEFRQRRNGSDASFKSTSSTESDSMPFANDNAGTIKQRNSRAHPALAALSYTSHTPSHSPALSRRSSQQQQQQQPNLGASDVLNDIGNMLAGLTDELDAMLEEENKQVVIKQKS